MDIIFYVNTSEKNACRPVLSESVTFSGTLRNDVEQSVVSPSFLIEVDPADTALFTKNYCYIADFGRYYHVTNIKSVRNSLVRVDLESDPLVSFFSEYGEQDVLIERAENLYNMLLPDGKVPVEAVTAYDKYVATSTPFGTSSIIGVCAGTNVGKITGLTVSDEYTADGTNNQFYLTKEYIDGTISVSVNGTTSTTWYSVSGPSGTYIAFNPVLSNGDLVVITYATP